MYLSSYDSQCQPLFYFRGYPIRLAMLLVIVHCLAMIAGAVIGVAASDFLGMSAVRPFPEASVNWPDWWQWGSYVFNNGPSVWFLLDMYFLWRWGSELETVFGRRTFGAIYGVLWLLPPLIGAVAMLATSAGGFTLAGTQYIHFYLFLGIVFLYPNAGFCGTPLKLWFIGLALFLVYLLADLARRYWIGCSFTICNAAAVYLLMRRAGLSPRFSGVVEAVTSALPKSRPKPAPRPYEPKMKPRPDISPERAPVAKIDAILEKISRSGIESLDDWERRELERASSELKRQDR